MLSLFILVPLLLLFVINIPLNFIRGKLAAVLTGLLLAAQAVAVMLHHWLNWTVYTTKLETFFAFKLGMDNLSLIVLFTIAIVAFVSLLVGQSTISNAQQKFHFNNLLLLSVIGMNATALICDIFSLYLFIEVTAASVFVLIAMEKDKHGIEGTFKYLVLSMIATVFMLTGTAFFVLAAGGTSFETIHGAFSAVGNKMPLTLAMGLFTCGLLIKSGVAPFHAWVPDAYSSAPASVSVLLAGIITKASGVYALLRLFSTVFVLNPSFQNVLMLTGALSIVMAALAALTQDNLKRMLSYSSISQVGYIVLALGCGTPLALVGAVFHFFNHAIFKSLLFVNAASVEKRLGTTSMDKIAGFGSKMPVTSSTSLIALLSTAGIPPLSGFWSKLIIIMALLKAGNTTYAVIALLSSVLTLAYFLAFERKVFFGKSQTVLEDKGPVSFGIHFCEVLLGAIIIAVGIGFPFVLNTWLLPLKNILQ